MENARLEGSLESYRKSTVYIEQRAGITLWDNLAGPEIDSEKQNIRDMW